MKLVLIIDDEVKLRTLLARIIAMEGFDVVQAGTAKLAWQKLEQQPEIQVVLCDVKLPDDNGVQLAHQLKQRYPHLQIILLTAYGNIADGVQAIKNGAFNYLTKGDDNHRIVPLLHDAFLHAGTTAATMVPPKASVASFTSITAVSKPMQQAIQLAQKVAATQTSVLLTGETGTGKEVFARAIHYASSRAAEPFVAINCSAFSRELLETEMFGHKQGAFTGALKDHMGVFEQAHNGTLFLDELGDMSTDLQAKLLRALESGEFIKVGDSKPTQVNVRVIAATHKNLETAIEQGHFREDLFYRISVFQISLPALRHRPEDIEPLANELLLRCLQKMEKQAIYFSAECMQKLVSYPWPGNVRELKNVIERAVILTNNTEPIQVDALPANIQISQPTTSATTNTSLHLAEAERLHIQKVLHHTQGNKTKAAELLHIALTTLYRKMAEYKIEA
ncbi:MAG: sigma-54-dependent Fis family transcriptional regulator [Bacteroidetes bacterium]|nr:MAG: sigma-54-dependent Fis family transcriptional regulator [Bacteroidota bacterium]TAF93525.1 MAG: sigma-54-dependent Fis family transcriptional regulator [Bacteroidota bacterium]